MISQKLSKLKLERLQVLKSEFFSDNFHTLACHVHMFASVVIYLFMDWQGRRNRMCHSLEISLPEIEQSSAGSS